MSITNFGIADSFEIQAEEIVKELGREIIIMASLTSQYGSVSTVAIVNEIIEFHWMEGIHYDRGAEYLSLHELVSR